MNSTESKAIIGPILALLKSHKVMVALASLLAYLIIQGSPSLTGQQNTLAGVILVLAGLLVGGITLEDAARNIAAGPQTWQDAVRAIVMEALDMLLVKLSATPSPSTKPVEGSAGDTQHGC